MRVPNLARSDKTAEILNNITNSTNATSDRSKASPRRRRRRQTLGESIDLARLSNNTARSTPAQLQPRNFDEKRGTCPSGKAFYKCASGFTGCCSVDPCALASTCPDNQSPSSAHSTTKISSDDPKSTSVESMSKSSSIESASISTKAPLQTGSQDGSGKNAADSSSGGNHVPVAGIVGGVMAAMLLLAILILAIAFCIRKRKQEVEETTQPVAIAPVISQPIGEHQFNAHSHNRQVSTSHDVFAPHGGFYHGDDPTIRDSLTSSKQVELTQAPTPPGLRAEGAMMFLPTSVYKAPRQKPTPQPEASWLASPSTESSGGSRSPRFYEHFADVAASGPPSAASPQAMQATTDSPTLGRHKSNPRSSRSSPSSIITRPKHMTSWKFFNAGSYDR